MPVNNRYTCSHLRRQQCQCRVNRLPIGTMPTRQTDRRNRTSNGTRVSSGVQASRKVLAVEGAAKEKLAAAVARTYRRRRRAIRSSVRGSSGRLPWRRIGMARSTSTGWRRWMAAVAVLPPPPRGMLAERDRRHCGSSLHPMWRNELPPPARPFHRGTILPWRRMQASCTTIRDK